MAQPALAAWRALAATAAGSSAPEPRSGHAVALLRPSASVLLFGGSDGAIFFNDFHVLEPATFASTTTTTNDSTGAGSPPELELSAVGDLAGLSQSSSAASDAGAGGSEHDDLPELVWKRLVVTYAPRHPAAGDDADENERELPYVGGGRDYHSMHYVPAPRDEEERAGLRVLVLGNILVATEHDPKRFEMDELRVEELRVHQPLLEAQWQSRRVAGAWRPRARQAHSSVLIGERLFCFGGKNAATTAFYNDMFYLDVRRNVWVNPPSTGSFPAPRSYASMSAAGRDQIFLYGGYDGRQQFGGLYVYDVPQSRWDKVAAVGEKPTARMNHSLTFVAPRHLIMFGGREHSRRQNDVSLFDIVSESWTQLSPDSSAQARAAARRSTTTSNSSSRQSAPSDSPMGRTAHTAVHYDVRAHVRQHHQQEEESAVNADERILIFGGYGGSHRWLNDLQLLTIPASVFRASVTPEEIDTDETAVALSGCPPSHARSLNQSSSQQLQASSSLKKRRRHGDSQDMLSGSSELLSSQIGTQTALLQLLQHSERHEEGISRILAFLTHEQTRRRQEEHTRLQLQTHVEQLEHQLSAADQKAASLERKLQLSEKEKHEVQEQLVAADTELFVARKALAAMPSMKNEIIDAIKQTNQFQFKASNLIEDRLSSIHNALEEMRHSSGERTETDDSPQKKDSMFPDDSRSDSSQPHLYPERVVINLEERLRSALASNQDLTDKLTEMEARLKRAEAHSEQIRQLSLAWMHESP